MAPEPLGALHTYLVFDGFVLICFGFRLPNVQFLSTFLIF
jgi:hypothetical protein